MQSSSLTSDDYHKIVRGLVQMGDDHHLEKGVSLTDLFINITKLRDLYAAEILYIYTKYCETTDMAWSFSDGSKDM